MGFIDPEGRYSVPEVPLSLWDGELLTNRSTGEIMSPIHRATAYKTRTLFRTKTCYAVSRRAYFPGWQSYTGLLVRNCAVCNLQQRS